MAAKDVESAALSGFRLGVYCSRIDRELVRPAWQRGLRSIRGASKGGHNRWAHESEDQKQKREQLRGKVREHVFKLLSQRNPPTRTSAIAAAARRFRISPSRARTWSQDIPYRVAIRCVLKSLVEKKYLQSDPLKDLPVDAWNALRDHPQNIAQ
jgi:hypothetical protein